MIELDINAFIQIVNGVGFPIAACIAMAVFIVWDKKNRQKYNEDNAKKQEEMLNKLAQSVDNNTVLLQKLLLKLGE